MTGPHRNLWQIVKTYMSTKSYTGLGLMSQNKMVAGYTLGHFIDHPELIRPAANDLMKLYQDGKIKPKVDSVWAYEDVGVIAWPRHDVTSFSLV